MGCASVLGGLRCYLLGRGTLDEVGALLMRKLVTFPFQWSGGQVTGILPVLFALAVRGCYCFGQHYLARTIFLGLF